jgi:hypothetical protein
VRAVLGCREKRREVRRGPVKPEVGALPFIGAGEGHAGARKGETIGSNGLNAIEGRRLNEGLRGGESRRGVKTLLGISMLEAERRRVAGGDEEKRQQVGQHGEGDEADRRAPHGSDVGEKRHLCRNAQSQRKYAFRQMRQSCLGRMGLAGIRRPVGQSRPARAGLGRMGRNLRKIPFRIKIGFLNIPRLWKFAQGDLGGILTCGFFLKSSRLSKYFRKMKYAMPWYATIGKIN